MKLIDLLKKANEDYPDGFLENYFDEATGEAKDVGGGDTLAEFIVIELRETFDKDATDDEQYAEAVRVLERGRDDLEKVIDCLTKKHWNKL